MHPPWINNIRWQKDAGLHKARGSMTEEWKQEWGQREREHGGWKIKTGKLKEERRKEKAWERNANSWTCWTATENWQSYFNRAPYFRTRSQHLTAYFMLFVHWSCDRFTCLSGGDRDIFERSEYRSVLSRDLITMCTCVWPSIIKYINKKNYYICFHTTHWFKGSFKVLVRSADK